MQPEFLLYPQLHPSIGGKSDPRGQVGVSRVRHLPWAQKSREHPNPQSYRSIIFDTKFLKIKINAKKSMRNNTSEFYKNRLFWFVCLFYNTGLFHNRNNGFQLGCSSQAGAVVMFPLWVYEGG